MKAWNKNSVALSLISLSLCLLLVFIAKWAHTSYNTQKDILAQEIDYKFLEALNSLEDSLLHQVLLKNMSLDYGVQADKKHSVFKQKTLVLDSNKESELEMDSVSIVYKESFNSTEIAPKGGSIKMVVQSGTDSLAKTESPSLLSMLIKLSADPDSITDETILNPQEIVSRISKQYDIITRETDLPKTYEISIGGDSLKADNLAVSFYTDIATSKKYYATFNDYQGYLFYKIRYDLLFGFILFLAIGLSFLIIYSNWKKQQKLIDIKNDLISNMTHELKTPIATVSVALEALSKFDVIKDKRKSDEYLEISKKELGRLRLLVDKVLKMSLFESGLSNLHKEKFDAKNLVEEILDSMKIQFEKHNADVKFISTGSEFNMKADKIHISNVIFNLLDNALKYCDRSPKIEIELSSSSDHIDIRIRDNGIGISKDNQEKVLEKFYRVPAGDRHDVKGYGLGLSYVASIIKQHEGSLQIDSTLNEGSDFHIRLKK